MTDENLDKVGSQEPTPLQESEPTPPQSDRDGDRVDSLKDDKKIQSDLNALKGIVSAKDKKIQELEKKLSGELASLQNKLAVKDMLLDSSFPEPVKAALKGELDSLTPSNFQDRAGKYLEVFTQGAEVQKQESIKFVNQKPETKTPANIDEIIASAKTEDELFTSLMNAGMR